MAAPTIDLARQMLTERQSELREENKRIEKALNALSTANGRHKPRAAIARVAGTVPPRTPRKRRKGRKGQPTRADQAVKLIAKAGEKGLDATHMAKTMKIKPNYLYRVLGDLEKEGLVRKDGRTYFPIA